MPDSENHEIYGWTRRFVACEPRLSEAVELYKESGFEVLLVPISSKEARTHCIKNKEKNECHKCYDGVEEKYRIIYTRPDNQTS